MGNLYRVVYEIKGNINITEYGQWATMYSYAKKEAENYIYNKNLLYCISQTTGNLVSIYIERIIIDAAIFLAQERTERNYELMKAKDELEFDYTICKDWCKTTPVRKNIIIDFINWGV